MTGIPFDTAEDDPRFGNPSREKLLTILQYLQPPPNFKVILTVNATTERLQLKVLKHVQWELRIGKYAIWRSKENWDDPSAEQRRIEGRSYDALLQQLMANPEFLEFDVEVSGATQARPIQLFHHQ